MMTKLSTTTRQRLWIGLCAVLAIPLAVALADAAQDDDGTEATSVTSDTPVGLAPSEGDRPPPPSRGGEPRFEDLDANGDGQISADEYTRGPRAERRGPQEDLRRGDWDAPPREERYYEDDRRGRGYERDNRGTESDHRPPPPPHHSTRGYDDYDRRGPESHGRGPRGGGEFSQRGPEGCDEHGGPGRGPRGEGPGPDRGRP